MATRGQGGRHGPCWWPRDCRGGRVDRRGAVSVRACTTRGRGCAQGAGLDLHAAPDLETRATSCSAPGRPRPGRAPASLRCWPDPPLSATARPGPASRRRVRTAGGRARARSARGSLAAPSRAWSTASWVRRWPRRRCRRSDSGSRASRPRRSSAFSPSSSFGADGPGAGRCRRGLAVDKGALGWAVFLVLWGFFGVSGVDNVLKPHLISRGSKPPLSCSFWACWAAWSRSVCGVFSADLRRWATSCSRTDRRHGSGAGRAGPLRSAAPQCPRRLQAALAVGPAEQLLVLLLLVGVSRSASGAIGWPGFCSPGSPRSWSDRCSASWPMAAHAARELLPAAGGAALTASMGRSRWAAWQTSRSRRRGARSRSQVQRGERVTTPIELAHRYPAARLVFTSRYAVGQWGGVQRGGGHAEASIGSRAWISAASCSRTRRAKHR